MDNDSNSNSEGERAPANNSLVVDNPGCGLLDKNRQRAVERNREFMERIGLHGGASEANHTIESLREWFNELVAALVAHPKTRLPPPFWLATSDLALREAEWKAHVGNIMSKHQATMTLTLLCNQLPRSLAPQALNALWLKQDMTLDQMVGVAQAVVCQLSGADDQAIKDTLSAAVRHKRVRDGKAVGHWATKLKRNKGRPLTENSTTKSRSTRHTLGAGSGPAPLFELGQHSGELQQLSSQAKKQLGRRDSIWKRYSWSVWWKLASMVNDRHGSLPGARAEGPAEPPECLQMSMAQFQDLYCKERRNSLWRHHTGKYKGEILLVSPCADKGYRTEGDLFFTAIACLVEGHKLCFTDGPLQRVCGKGGACEPLWRERLAVQMGLANSLLPLRTNQRYAFLEACSHLVVKAFGVLEQECKKESGGRGDGVPMLTLNAIHNTCKRVKPPGKVVMVEELRRQGLKGAVKSVEGCLTWMELVWCTVLLSLSTSKLKSEDKIHFRGRKHWEQWAMELAADFQLFPVLWVLTGGDNFDDPMQLYFVLDENPGGSSLWKQEHMKSTSPWQHDTSF